MGKPVQSDPFDSPEVPKAVAPRLGEYRAGDEHCLFYQGYQLAQFTPLFQKAMDNAKAYLRRTVLDHLRAPSMKQASHCQRAHASCSNEKCAESAKARGKDGTASAGAKSSPKKRVYTGSSEQVPKKACSTSSASIARTMAGPTRPTTPKHVPSTTRTERL
jgi:hypothetical protein